MRRAQVRTRLVGADAGDDRGEPGEVAEQEVLGREERERHAHLADGLGPGVARAHHVAHRGPRGDAHVEDEDPRLRRAQQLAPLDVVVVHDLDRLAVLAAITDGHRVQGHGPGGESGRRGHPEAQAHLLALVREAQGDGRRLDRPPRRCLEPDDRLGGAAGEAPREHADLDRLARGGEGQRRDVRRDAQGERGHDLQLVPALAADRGPVVAPGDRGAQRRRDAADPAPREGDQGRRAPRPRLVGGDEQLVAVPVPRPAPVRLRRAGVGSDRHREARAVRPRSRERSGLGVEPVDRPAGGGLELERLHLELPARVVEESHRDADRLAGGREPVVGARLEHEALGQAERSLDVLLFLPEALRDLGPRHPVGDPAVEAPRELADGREHLGQSRHGRLRRGGVEGRAGPGGLRLQGEERRRDPRGGAREAGDRSVDAVEHVALGTAHGRFRVEETERPRGRAGIRHDLPGSLAPVQGSRAGAELLPRHPEDRVVDAGRHVHGRARHRPVAADAPLVDLPGLPGPQSLLELPGEPRRESGGAERLAREPPHRLVVLPPALALEGQGEDHVGAEGADDPHDVPERLLATPLRQRLLHAEREPELVGPPEVLLGPVVAVDRHQLPGPQDTEGLEQLGPDRVLAALAAGHGEERRPDAQAAREPYEDAVHLVVGVGRHVEDPAGNADLAQGEGEAARPAVEVEGLEGRLGRRERREKAEGHGNDDGDPTRDHDQPL